MVLRRSDISLIMLIWEMMDSLLALFIRAPMSLTARPIRRFIITIENRRTYAAKNRWAVPVVQLKILME